MDIRQIEAAGAEWDGMVVMVFMVGDEEGAVDGMGGRLEALR